MGRFTADPPTALTFSFARLKEPRSMNPAWLPLLDEDLLAATALTEDELRVVDRALIAPVVCLLSVTSRGRRQELRIALDVEGAVLLEREGEGSWTWREAAAREIPAVIEAMLPGGSPLAAPPRMTARAPHNALPFEEPQRRAIAERVRAGMPAHEAIAAQEDLSAQLRDALLSDGDRAAFDFTLYVPPSAQMPPAHFHLLRRWTVGEHGLYSIDDDEPLGEGIHVVEPGDVLATVLPMLSEGVALARGGEVAA